MISRKELFLALFAGALGAGGCRHRDPIAAAKFPITTIYTPPQIAQSRHVTRYPLHFTDVTIAAGIHWAYSNGATGRHYFIESTGGGVAFFDYNNDGLLDIFAVQGGPVPNAPGSQASFPTRNALYKNNGNGTFTDVTAGSGLDAYTGYGQGVSIVDFDNDGWPDIYITAYGGNRLFRNNGNGTFTDVTERAGLADTAGPEWPWPLTSAWGDYDNDGYLDLFVCHYAHWSLVLDRPCPLRGEPSYCRPQVYSPNFCRLYHNNGDGTFTDVTKHAGIQNALGKAMSALWFDYDEDGWLDIFVTNDTMPNFLFHNNRNGTFTDRALQAGVAVGSEGQPLSGMGIAAGDFFGDGHDSLVVVNFSGEPKSIYHNLGNGLFEDRTYQAGMESINLQFLGFGLESLDYDLDGHLDFVVGNGHVLDHIEILGAGSSYAQSQQLFHNDGQGQFVEDIRSLGDLAKPRVTRGLAVGDYDNDGDPDVVMVGQNGPLQLFRNDGGNQNHWITFRLEGLHSNRDAIGAKVVIHTRYGKQTAWVHGGGSYVSHSDTRLTFGLADLVEIEGVEVRWPRGLLQKFGPLEANRFYWLGEGEKPRPDSRIYRV